MGMNTENPQTDESPARPLHPHQRRVLGVLVEKAKTTPDNYPMTLNAIISACNQKSNRDPVMQLDADDVQTALDRLRGLGAVAEIQGSGRVSKFRHHAYDWLDIRGAQAAILMELFLRGPQTLGELRQRASRMESIPDLAAARDAVEKLIEKGLAVPLRRVGRGQPFTHRFYEGDERLHHPEIGAALQAAETGQPIAAMEAPASAPVVPSSTPAVAEAKPNEDRFAQLQREVEELRERVRRLEERAG